MSSSRRTLGGRTASASDDVSLRSLPALALGLWLSSGAPAQTPRPDPAAPRLLAIRGEELLRTRELLRAGDALLRPALDKLLADADRVMATAPVAVTDKKTLPPSGDRHDYFSLSPYWWPDTGKPDGLPYVRRDGETNPESKQDLDQPRVAALGDRVQALALAYFFTGDEAYARAAARQLRVWFLDPATRMNPHLRFAQLVRGIDRERGSGIIDTRWFIEVVDAIGLLEGSASWTVVDQRGMKEWFARYLTWLRTSPNGEHEREARNNHGSWFAAQTAAYALFTGDTAAAGSLLPLLQLQHRGALAPGGAGASRGRGRLALPGARRREPAAGAGPHRALRGPAEGVARPAARPGRAPAPAHDAAEGGAGAGRRPLRRGHPPPPSRRGPLRPLRAPLPGPGRQRGADPAPEHLHHQRGGCRDPRRRGKVPAARSLAGRGEGDGGADAR